MSKSNYEKCHVSYRGRMEREIDTAREMLRKHKKPCAAAVRELRDKTDLSLHESCSMIRCLWRDDKLEQLQVENAKLQELMDYMTPIAWYAGSERERNHMRELGIEVER